jgi:hypothetical protein
MFSLFKTKKKLSRADVIEKFDEITDQVAARIVHNFCVGKYVIRKEGSLYSIYLNDDLVCDSILFFGVAYAVASCLEKNTKDQIDYILSEEKHFTKKYMDMVVYKNTNKWDLYESTKIDALEHLWNIKYKVAFDNADD